MARRKKDSLSAFDAAMNEFGFNNPYETSAVSDLDNDSSFVDIDDLNDNDDDPTNLDGDKPKVEEGDKPGNVHDDDSDIPDDVLNNINNNVNSSNEPDNSTDDLNNTDNFDAGEAEQIGVFFDAFAEELGWDVSEDDKPNSIPALIDYIKDVVDQNSVPQYADQRIQQLDEYVKNGGNFEDFYQRQQQGLNYDTIDLEDESNQKAAVREFLKYQGYTDDQISKKIERYEDGDMLEEEAEDAVARLKYINEQQLAYAQQQQEEARQAQEMQARQFMNDLTTTINSLDNIRGIAIPKADQKALLDYITLTDENGLTRYQKDFNGNMINNLIESAYFTMKGDALLGEAKSSGRTSAANKLRTMLRHQSKNHTRYANNDNQRSILDIASMY